jgi:hypothetical protein
MYGIILFVSNPAAKSLPAATGYDAKSENKCYACWTANSGRHMGSFTQLLCRLQNILHLPYISVHESHKKSKDTFKNIL